MDRRGKPWTCDELDYLKEHYTGNTDFATMVKHLGRTEVAIKSMANKAGLRRRQPAKGNRYSTMFTDVKNKSLRRRRRAERRVPERLRAAFMEFIADTVEGMG